MYSTQRALKLHMYVRNKKGQLKKYGKIHQVVFHPSKAQAIGVSIKRPDLLLMKKRDDRFVPFDRITRIDEGLEVIDSPDAWDKAACKRLGVEYDQCIIWDYMPVVSKDGSQIGLVKEVFFDEENYKVSSIDVSPSSANKALLGASRIPVEQICGYSDGAIVVSDEAKSLEEAGGLAAKAGEGWAKTKHEAGAVTKKAGKAAKEGTAMANEAVSSARKKMNDAVDEHEARKEAEQRSGELSGVDKAAKQFGRQLGRASGMFKDFKNEYDKASKGK